MWGKKKGGGGRGGGVGGGGVLESVLKKSKRGDAY